VVLGDVSGVPALEVVYLSHVPRKRMETMVHVRENDAMKCSEEHPDICLGERITQYLCTLERLTHETAGERVSACLDIISRLSLPQMRYMGGKHPCRYWFGVETYY
jgi:hypothetical protein